MRGQSGFGLMASNISATAPDTALRKAQNRHPQMCWACQKEKSTYGGKLTVLPGFHKFVCKDCCDASAAKKAAL